MRNIYVAAKKFLISELSPFGGKQILEGYLTPPYKNVDPISINELYFRLLSSAQNSNMKAGVVGRAIGGVGNLGETLFKFNPKKVVREYSENPDFLLNHIITTLRPRGKIRRTSKSIWPKYCKTILSAAKFFSQFKNGSDFYSWANYLYEDHRSTGALPLILDAEIDGIGYALACDFLKELGFVDYGKPDVHIIDIFSGIGLCEKKASPYLIQKIISQIANAARVTPYSVDKVFWLIGSGKLYNHSEFGNNGYIGQKKVAFIKEYKKNYAKI